MTNRTLRILIASAVISYLNIYPEARAAEPVSSGSAAAPQDSVSVDLDDFVIVTTKKLVQSDGAKLTYNVSEDPDSKSSSILELLRKVPGVSVDAEDNVKVNGQSNFKILMNGHDDPMLSGDIKTVLKSMQAGSIKKIEVISEPGAKYDAEGTGGILNIITDNKSRLSGFMTQLGAWISPYNAGGNVTGKIKLKNVMLGATVNYNNGKLFRRKRHNYNENEDLTGGPNHFSTTRSSGTDGWDYTGLNLNMSWDPDTLNLFTMSVNFGNNHWENPSLERRAMYGLDNDPADPESSLMWEMQRSSNSYGIYNWVGAQASYQHSFGRNDNNLVLSYLYSYDYQGNRQRYLTEMLSGTLTGMPFSADKSLNHNNSDVIQLDYSNQFNSKHLLEVGLKADLMNNRGNSESCAGMDPDSAVTDEEGRVSLTQYRQIYAVYGTYTGSFVKLNVKAGLRYEFTRMGLSYRVGKYDDFTTYLHDLVPNCAVSYNFTSASSLRLAYQMRIGRPNLWRLNPYRNDLTPGYLQYGNPDLKSEKSHLISLGYSNYDGKFTGGAKLTYRYVGNSITDIIFMKENVINSTYANIGKSHSVTLELNGGWDITDALKWSTYLSTHYGYMKARSEMLDTSKAGWTFYGNMDLSYSLPRKWRVYGYGGYSSPWFDMQTRGSDYYYYGLSASKSLLKDDALSLTFGLSNIYPVSRKGHYTQSSESARMYRSWDRKQWNLRFAVTWKFGGLKAEVKRTAAEVASEGSGEQSGNGNKK